MIFLLALSFFHIGTFADAAEDFSPLGRGLYLPELNLVDDIPRSGSQVCRHVWPRVIILLVKIPTACSRVDKLAAKAVRLLKQNARKHLHKQPGFFFTLNDLQVFINLVLTNRRTNGWNKKECRAECYTQKNKSMHGC